MEYLLKSILCLVLLLLIHRVLLQREVLHRFNRFYLLTAIVTSFLIPLLTIEVPAGENKFAMDEVAETESTGAPNMGVEVENSIELDLENTVEMQKEVPSEAELSTISESTFPLETLIWAVYFLGSFLFLIRFIRNMQVLRNKIRNNPHVPYREETIVLHSENQSPFSFLKYIFIFKPSFEREGISDAVFAHEQCHVREKHSWDILFIEALLIPFWFHPGLHFAKQSIRLNHEFIADQAALNTTSIKDYQHLLLTLLIAKPTLPIASSLNFSLTKKRLQMMKKNVGGPFKWVKIAMLLPLIGFVIYIFSEKVTAQADAGSESESTISDTRDAVEKVNLNIRLISENEIELDGSSVSLVEFSELLDGIQSENTTVTFSADPGVKMGLLAEVQEILRKKEIRRVIYENHSNQNQSINSKDEKEAYYRNAHIIVEDENMIYTHKPYSQLNENEKKGLLEPMIARARQHPDPALFEDWKDNKTYALWIDGTVIANEKLNDYTAANFVGFFQSSVMASARSKRFPQPYQVHLYTEKFFDKEFGPNSENVQPRTNKDTITLTQRMVTWHKDISRFPDPTTAYLQKYARYENLRNSGAIYSLKSQEEKAELDKLHRELSDEYLKSSEKRKKSLKQPISPSSISENENQNSRKSEIVLTKSEQVKPVYSLASSPQLQTKNLKEYLELLAQFQTKAYENRLFSQPSHLEIEELQFFFKTLDASYIRISFEERRRVKSPSFPYAKIEKGGIVRYKKVEDLTEQERKELSC